MPLPLLPRTCLRHSLPPGDALRQCSPDNRLFGTIWCMRRLVPFAACLLLASCANGIQVATPGSSPSAAPSAWLLYQGEPSSSTDPDRLQPGEVGGPDVVLSGTFLPYRPGATAITY